jgi:hypothetical protein
MPGTSDQWRALDRQNERLVDAIPQAPAVTAAVPAAEAHSAEADPDTSPRASRPAGRHPIRADAAAVSALAG